MCARRRARGHEPAHTEALFGTPEEIDHKTLRLCRQIEEAVVYALAGSADPVLRDLQVVDIRPLRGARLLQVRVTSLDPEAGYADLLGRLDRARSYLRQEVASAIHRKRVPTLELVVVPASEVADV